MVGTIVAICVIASGGYAIIEAQFEFVRQSAAVNVTDLQKQIDHLLRDQNKYLALREFAASQHEQEVVNASFIARFIALETAQRDIISHGARSPVESTTVDVLSASIDKRFEAAQQQINDINRQIAASILQPTYQRSPVTSPAR
jgi:hypothetical protein